MVTGYLPITVVYLSKILHSMWFPLHLNVKSQHLEIVTDYILLKDYRAKIALTGPSHELCYPETALFRHRPPCLKWTCHDSTIFGCKDPRKTCFPRSHLAIPAIWWKRFTWKLLYYRSSPRKRACLVRVIFRYIHRQDSGYISFLG